jgi:prephenate dehydrogenase
MASVIKRALQGFSYGYRTGGKMGGLLARRKAYAAGWAARIVAEQKTAARKARLRQFGASAKTITGWAAVIAAIGAVVLTSTMGDEISQLITGQKTV